MKTFKHLALTLALSAGAAHVAAADRVAPTFPEPATLTSGHEYYLYNVDAGKCLTSLAAYSNLTLTDAGERVRIAEAGENGYTLQSVSSQCYLYRNTSTTVGGTNNLNADSYWDITQVNTTLTIQSNESSSHYDANLFLGSTGGDPAVAPNLDASASGTAWQLIDATTWEYYSSKLALYNALQATDAYSFNVDKFEEIYSDAGSTTEELADAAATLNASLEISTKIEIPEWSDYPIFFENELENPWNVSGDGFSPQNSKKLTATVVVDEEATFTYRMMYSSYDEIITVSVDGEPMQRFWHEDQKNGRYFIRISPGKHVIEWQRSGGINGRHIYAIGVKRTPSITVNLLEPGSLGTEVLYHVNHLNDVRRLKVVGPMNDDDWAKISMMSNLFSLDLSEAETEEIPESQFGTNAQGDWDWMFFHEIKLPKTLKKIGSSAFSNSNITEIDFPEGLQEIGDAAFSSSKIKEAFLPSTALTLGSHVFRYCVFLESISLPEDIVEIPSRVFSECPVLDDSLRLPDKLEVLGEGAFSSPNLTITYFPESLHEIGHWAFAGIKNDTIILRSKQITFLGRSPFSNCPNLVYAELPVSYINHDFDSYQETGGMFDNSRKLKTIVLRAPTMVDCNSLISDGLVSQVTLKVPSYLVNTYKLDEYWYTYGNIEGFSTADVDSWTIYKPLVLGARDRFEGTPDMALRGGGSLKVNGEAAMTFHNLYTETNVNDLDYTTSLLSNCENLSIQGTYRHGYYVQGNTWYFVSLPFDVRVSDIELPAGAQKAVRYYDGAQRAANGAGNSWKNYAEDDVITAGTGFILQTNKGGWLYFPALEGETKQYVVAYKEFAKALAENPSATAADGGWNLVGNPYQTIYNISHINFTAPITVWNVRARRYDAYSIIDDEFVLTPNQAFFVQCPEEVASIAFPLEGRQTSPEIVSAQAKRKPHMRGLVARRQLIDLTLSAGDASDRTRVVLNEAATEGYDLNADASKFMSLDASVPQLYTLGTDGTAYAINERPEGDGRVSLGLYLPADGAYTLALTRQEGAKVYLFDRETGAETDLTAGEYNFTARAGQTDKRFELRLEGGETTGIGSAGSADGTFVVTVTADGLLLTGVTGAVKVYTTDGRQAGEALAEGGSCRVALPAGLYLVKAGGQTVKVRVD